MPGALHPESPARFWGFPRMLLGLPSNLAVRNVSRTATFEELCRVHGPTYVAHVWGLDGRHAELDEETILSPGSVGAACVAVGMCLDLVDDLMGGKASNALALVRPPGHHALLDRGMGYCIFNNIACAAAHARALGVKRILVVDWDAHHGNGTEEYALRTPGVAYVSMHEDALFPQGTGTLVQLRPQGSIINIPLPAGAGDADVTYALRTVVRVLANAFRPELLLVSCGFDAHMADPMSSLTVTEVGFAAMTAIILEMAAQHAAGRALFVLEGGYNPASLAESLRRVAETLAGRIAPVVSGVVRDDVRALADGLQGELARLYDCAQPAVSTSREKAVLFADPSS
ncbi:MAG: histone deacetylase [Polyangiaceae bacterium]